MVGLWKSHRSSKESVSIHALVESAVVDDEGCVQIVVFVIVGLFFEREEYVYSTLSLDWDATEFMLMIEIGLFGCKLSKDKVKRGVKTTFSCLYHMVRDNPVGRLCITL